MKRYKIMRNYECRLNLNNWLGSICFDVPYSINTPTKFIKWIGREMNADVYGLDIELYDNIIDTVKSAEDLKSGAIRFCNSAQCRAAQNQPGVVAQNKVDSVSFFVSDKVQHVPDIQNILRSQYDIKSKRPSENDDFAPDDVCMITGVWSDFVTGLRTDDDEPMGYELKHFNVARLDPTKDVLLNRKLLQIWPNNTGKMPEQLVNLFKSYNQNVI